VIAAREHVRLTIFAIAATSLLAVPSAARADTYTSFQSRAEGCSGGGSVCGGFPLIPAGSAASSFHADDTGAIDIGARADGGIPSLTCVPAVTCLPVIAQYHAEAAAIVWVDLDVPDGAHSVYVRAVSHVTEVTKEATPAIGHATASAVGTLSALEAEGASRAACSDSGEIIGRAIEFVTTEPADHVLQTTIACAGDGAVLSGARWRVALRAKVAATTDGGSAHARVRAELTSVTFDIA